MALDKEERKRRRKEAKRAKKYGMPMPEAPLPGYTMPEVPMFERQPLAEYDQDLDPSFEGDDYDDEDDFEYDMNEPSFPEPDWVEEPVKMGEDFDKPHDWDEFEARYEDHPLTPTELQ